MVASALNAHTLTHRDRQRDCQADTHPHPHAYSPAQRDRNALYATQWGSIER